MKSFVKSLPSHRKKEKVRKSRHQKSGRSRQDATSRSSITYDRSSVAADGRRGIMDESSRGTSTLHSQSQSPGSIVEATEVQYPPPPAMMMMTGMARKSFDNDAKEEGADDDDDNDAAENNHAESSQETMLSHSQDSIVEATEVQYPPPAMASARKPSSIARESVDWRDRGDERKARSSLDLRVSPVHSSLAVASSRTEFDEAYDEETVGMNSPRRDHEEIHKPYETNNDRRDDGAGDSGDTEMSNCVRNQRNVERKKTDEPHAINMCRESSAEKNLSLETEPRGNMSRESKHTERNLSLETEPVKNSREKASGEAATSPVGHGHDTSHSDDHADSHHDGEGEEPNGGEQDAELVLSMSDIRDCINAMKSAKQIMEADPSQDPFDGIDIEQWQSIFEDFEKYIAALGDSTSTTSEELQQINNHDKAFAIFDRGMDVNHCNAVFIYHMIRTISGGIGAYGKSCHDAHDGYEKLDHLARCLDTIFGVNEDSASVTASVSVSISKVERDNSTALTFTKALETQSQNDGLPLSTIQQPSASTNLPPHLQAMSQVFARFAEENTRPLQSQLDSTRNTLSVTREGAIELQRQALKLQDDLQDVQNETVEAKARQQQAEAELGSQKYEFERREESFERVKEHYKAEIARKDLELANVKERYERELKEAKAELARTKDRHTERRSTESRKRKESDGRRDGCQMKDKHQMKHKRSSEHHRHETINPNPIASIHAEPTSDEHISPSIPRNIEYHATDPSDGDVGESRKKSKVASSRQSRHSTGTTTSRKSRSAPYELQPPRRPRASSEPRDRGTNHKEDQHHVAARMNDEQAGEYSGRFGAAKRRNPLKSLAENSFVDHSSDASFREKKESKNRRLQSSARDNNRLRDSIEQGVCKPASNFDSSSRKQKVTKNPYLKQTKLAKNVTNAAGADDEPTYAYQEVVRGRDKRQALPGHECEECRKFHNALGKGYDRDQLVMECSRHRARHVPPSTPPNFWQLTFIDSVGSKKSRDSNSL